jgi:tRNA(Ile2) C34 agmatinyltransferase TiaS
MHGKSTRWIADLRKAYRPQRANRYCPRCKHRTEVDGQGVARCICGWTANSKLVLPPKTRIVNPAKELSA